MKYFKTIFLTMILIILSGCGTNVNGLNPFTESKNLYGFSFIDGKVLEIFEDKIIVKIENKDIITGSSYQEKLTNNIIKSSLFIVGMNTFIGNEKAIVSDVRRDQITFTINNSKIQRNQDIKIYIPKKTIAIMDFSLIGMQDSNIEKFTLEDMTTKLVQSGQYIVVERTKLDTILKEQKLADSGLLNEQAASKVGKLVAADIVLTGTFAKQGKKWNVNIRLIDVSTGIILSAINEKIDIDEFKLSQSKDSSNLTEDFEDNQFNNGWITKLINLNDSKSKAVVDKSMGANGTGSSYKIDYLLEKNKSSAVLLNKRLRDVSGYNGIKFYAKSTESTTVTVTLHDQNFDNSDNNKWIYLANVNNQWREYLVPFNEFIIGKGYAKTKAGGDGVLDLDNIEKIGIAVVGKLNSKNKPATIWIDEITFY